MLAVALFAGCASTELSPAASPTSITCALVDGVIDSLRWAPDDQSITLALTSIEGRGSIVQLDADTLKSKTIIEGVLVAPEAIDVGGDGAVYFGQLGDPSLLLVRSSNAEVVLTPSFEVWSHLAWTRQGWVLVDDQGDRAVVTAIRGPDNPQQESIMGTRDRVDSVWSDAAGETILVAHAPYPEVELDAGSTVTILRSGHQTDLTLPRLHVAKTVSMLPDNASIAFIESNTHRLGRLRVADGTVDWVATDVDGAEVSTKGTIATFTRTNNAKTDEVCLR